MDSHPASTLRGAAAAERIVRAQFGSLADQLGRAVLTHPFALPEAKALVNQADRIAAAAVAATAALKPADGPGAFQALTGWLAPGGALYVALQNACAELAAEFSEGVRNPEEYTVREFTAERVIVLDALSSFQVRAAGRLL